MQQNMNFQLGLLHFIHLLVNVDGSFDDKEKEAIAHIRKEEVISDSVYEQFAKSLGQMNEKEIYSKGISYLNMCTDDERLAAFVHLYRLADADSNINSKEVRFLFYSLKESKVNFEDVILTADLVKKQNTEGE